MKDYLVILAGSPRGGEATWRSLYKYVIDYLDADLALCCSDKWDRNNSLFKKANYIWTFEEMDNYSKYYKKHFNGSWKEYFDLSKDADGKETGLYSSGFVHFVFKDIVKKQYLDILKQYKNIIYTRFDQFHTEYHPKIKEDKIYIPEGEDYFGICDRHAGFPSKYSEKFLGICEYINHKDALLTKRDHINCETTFEDHLMHEGIAKKVKRYKRTQFTASLKNEHTNWRVAKYRVYFKKKLMMKYPGEFMKSLNNGIKKHGLAKTFFREKALTINYLYLLFRINLGKIKKFNL